MNLINEEIREEGHEFIRQGDWPALTEHMMGPRWLINNEAAERGVKTIRMWSGLRGEKKAMESYEKMADIAGELRLARGLGRLLGYLLMVAGIVGGVAYLWTILL